MLLLFGPENLGDEFLSPTEILYDIVVLWS